MLRIERPRIAISGWSFGDKKSLKQFLPLWHWMKQNRPMLAPGKALDFKQHPYLRQLYTETGNHVVVKKSAQLGISELLVSLAFWSCDVESANVLYIFPIISHVSDFSSARLGPAIEASPYLDSIVTSGNTKGGVERITLKRVGDGFLYLRGAQVSPAGQAPGLKSIDADTLIIDEVDECDPRAVPIAQKRLLHSNIARQWYVSTPSFTEAGIDGMYAESSQNEWMVKCEGCNEWQQVTVDNLVIEWDSLQRPVKWYDVPHCRKCKETLPAPDTGQWVVTYPDRDIAGYHPTIFANPRADYKAIVKALQTTDETKRREAYNQLLGECYTPTGGQMTAELLDRLRREYGHGPDRERAVAGVDVGRVLHLVIRDDNGRQLLATEVDSFDEVGRIFHRHKVDSLVIDAMPETRKARELQDNLPRGKCWLAYYVDDSKHKEIAQWDEAKGTVIIDRTRAMDDTYSQMYDGQFTLPANARDIRDYYAQLCAPVRVLEEKKNGTPVARYVHSQPDHYAHAETYCNVAMYAPRPGRIVSQVISANKLLG